MNFIGKGVGLEQRLNFRNDMVPDPGVLLF